jgi:hypothetical protein
MDHPDDDLHPKLDYDLCCTRIVIPTQVKTLCHTVLAMYYIQIASSIIYTIDRPIHCPDLEFDPEVDSCMHSLRTW